MKKADSFAGGKQTLIWAVDPQQREIRPSAASVQALVDLADRMNWRIKPVSILSPSIAELDRGLFQSVSDAQSMLNAFLKSYALPTECEPKVLVAEISGQEEAVKKLIHFSLHSKAAAIVVSSHGRSGIDRLFLGSFAETALKLSPLPVIFLNREAAKHGEAIFFPTDFSADSLSSYNHLLDTVAGRKVPIILFNEVTYPLPADMGMGVYLPDSFLLEQENWAKEEASRWVAMAKKKEIEARAVVRVGGIGAVSSDEVIAAADEFLAGVVVLTTKSSAMGRTLFGSVAFPVFRANHCLTMVYGPQTINHPVAHATHG